MGDDIPGADLRFWGGVVVVGERDVLKLEMKMNSHVKFADSGNLGGLPRL